MNFIAISGVHVDYAIPVELVREIAPTTGGTLAAGLDLADIVGARELSPAKSARLLILRTGDSQISLRVAGEITFRQLDASQLLAVPAVVTRGGGTSLVSGVAFVEGQRPLVVLNPRAFAKTF